MKKLISVLLLITLVFSLSACGGKGNALTGSLNDIVKDVTDSFDFSGCNFVYSGEDGAEDLLIFTYGFDDASMFEDYALCERADRKAAAFAIFRLKDGADPELVQSTLKIFYVEAMYSLFQLYIPEQYDIALGASFKTYDNAVVLAIYDTNGNTEIFNTVDKYAG